MDGYGYHRVGSVLLLELFDDCRGPRTVATFLSGEVFYEYASPHGCRFHVNETVVAVNVVARCQHEYGAGNSRKKFYHIVSEVVII